MSDFETSTNRSKPQLSQPQAVIIKDFDMPFGSIVRLMVKWTIAAIPAIFILCIIAALVGGFVQAIFRS